MEDPQVVQSFNELQNVPEQRSDRVLRLVLNILRETRRVKLRGQNILNSWFEDVRQNLLDLLVLLLRNVHLE